MKQYSGKIGIYSDSSTLPSLLEPKFKEKMLSVTSFNTLNGVDYTEFDYSIFDLQGNYKKTEELQRILANLTCKTIVLFPRYVEEGEVEEYNIKLKSLLSVNNNVGVILTPEIVGEGVKYNEKYISHELIRQSILSERIKVGNTPKLINIISIKRLIDQIVKELFSFGISGQILALSGYKRSSKSLLTNYLGVDEKNIILTAGNYNLVPVNSTTLQKLHFSLRLALGNTKKSFLNSINNYVEPKPTLSRKIEKKSEIKFSFPKRFVPSRGIWTKFTKAILVVLTLLLVPAFILLVSVVLFFVSYKLVFKNLSLSEKLAIASINTAKVTRNLNFGIPIYYQYGDLVVKSGELFSESLQLASLSTQFLSHATSDEIYDVSYYTDSISGVIEKIYTDSGFLQSDINNLRIPILNSNFREYRYKLENAKLFFSRLSHLVGAKDKAKYLILFQNNMELRPTGGFIGSFALLTLDHGKISEIVVNDVYSADGQLKGHVDPPEPIRVHLGEGGWYLRDANWDPDFPESAEKIEWFLNKEIDQTVDGVIAVDLFFVKKLLEVTGPIVLTDFGKTITADNFYTSIQSEVEENFFPGSIKKASFLTSLVKELTEKLQDVPSNEYYPVFNGIYESLNERHVQIHLHDQNAQKAISNLGFAGEVSPNTTYSLIDANLGVNKANQFIKRNHNLNLEFSKKVISHDLLVTYENTGTQALGNSSIYKSYTRLILPREANVIAVRLYDPFGGSEDVNFDTYDLEERKEIGFLINLLPKEIKKLKIVWEIDNTKFTDGGEYKLFVRKQAGTDRDGLRVGLKGIDLSLTKGTPSVYTTDLNEDFHKNIFLLPK